MRDLTGAVVLVTGGTGTFGQAFTRRLIEQHGVASVRVLSRGEAKQAQMAAAFGDHRVRFLLGDVRDYARLSIACRGVDVVVHAAAIKRIEAGENDPHECVLTNIIGSENVSRACIEQGVARAVMLSTDKCPQSTTLYGGTKFVAERSWCRANVYAGGTRTKLSALRYGNILGSTGSVVPLWREQMLTGTITITEPTYTRFFMPISGAVDLALLTIATMRGGEVVVSKMGSATVWDLAHAIAPDSYKRIVGPRPYERAHELLISSDEARYTFERAGNFVIDPHSPTWGEREPLPAEYVAVAPDFSYNSFDNPERLSVDQLRTMLEEA